jgi:hypothetical protein
MTNQAKIVVTAEDRASAVLRQVSGGVQNAAAAFARLGTLGAALGAGVVLNGLRALVSSIDDLDEAAQGIGTTAVQLANLRQAALESGVGAEALDTALTKLNVKISEAATGNEEAARLFRAFGVSVKDAAGEARPATDVLRDLAARFSQLQDGPSKAALAVELFGRSGAKLIPLLNQGADGLERFSGLTDETVREAARLQTEIDKLSGSWERLKNQIAGAVIPATNTAIDTLRRLDFKRIAEELLQPGGTVFALKELERQLGAASTAREQYARAVAEGQKVEGGEAAATAASASAIARRIKADEEAAKVAKERAAALDKLTKAQEAERRAQQQGDSQRDLLRLQRQDEAERAADEAAAERARRLQDLTGRSAVRQQADDLKLIEEALFNGAISLNEFDAAYTRVFGINGEATKAIEQTKNAADQLALTFASSLGTFIERGGSVKDFFESLLQDLLKLTTQLLIIKPLTEGLTAAFGGEAAKSSGGKQIAGLFGSLGSLFSGFFADGGFIPPGRFGVVGERGPELAFGGRSGQTIQPMGGPTININLPPGSNVTRQTANQIAGAVSRQLAIANRRNG